MSKFTKTFNRFNAEHPEVYYYFKQFTFEKIRQGYNTYSVGAIIERVRWETEAGADLFSTGEPFKINNNLRAEYSRKFMSDFPEYDGFFRIRRQHS